MKFLTEFKFDPRDYDRTLPILTLFRNFLNPIQNKKDDKEAHQNRIEQRKKMLCPIFIFNHGGEDNYRKPYSRKEITLPDEIAEGRVTTASGENTKFKDNFHKDKTLFPGDRRVHWDFLKGISNEYFSKIKFILFEHHYDLMIKKKYKFYDINKILVNQNFKQKLKLKMKFRKSFEYIYENQKNFD